MGVKHIKFWTKAGGGMTSKQGLFGKAAGKKGKENQMCVVFGKTVDSCITGGGDGGIYIWTHTTLARKVENAHEGPLFTITAVQDKVRLDMITLFKSVFFYESVGLCHGWKRRQSDTLGSGFQQAY